MAALTTRLSLTGPDATDPEDFFGASLGVVFPDDVTNQHGDADHGLLYTSPHLPHGIPLALAKVDSENDRRLFSHYLWNSSLLLAELIEAGTLGLTVPHDRRIAPPLGEFDVSGLKMIELGAGTGLLSIMAGLLGAKRVVVTDYPTPPVLEALKANVTSAVQAKFAPAGRFAVEEVLVEGYGWGELDTPLAQGNRHAFDRVLAADCLWIAGQHENLRRSIAWFLGDREEARAWVVGGFHTGRDKVAAFFDKEALASVGLEVEHLWERDCDGQDREWVWDRGIEDVSERKRWLGVGVLRRIRKRAEEGEEGP
jgi:predicted nicotinamide N-methyase